MVLNSLHSGGGTSLTPALEQAYKRHAAHPDQPLLIAVVSDCLIDVKDSIASMVAATHQHPLPNGVFVTFMQVGIIAEGMRMGPPGAQDSFYQLSHLKEMGGAYDASKLIPFSQLRKEGLAHCILTLLRNNTPKVQVPNVRESNRRPTK
jgi:hypothetical protein